MTGNVAKPATVSIHLRNNGTENLGGNGAKGKLQVFRADKSPTTNQSSASLSSLGGLVLGGNGEYGHIFLYDRSLPLGGKGLRMSLKARDGSFQFGGSGVNGKLSIFPESASILKENEATIRLDGKEPSITLKDKHENRVLGLASEGSWDDKPIAWFYVGAHKSEIAKEKEKKGGVIFIRSHEGNDSITLDGTRGDIILENADCAEEFDISPTEQSVIEPGTVMVIDNDGRLQVSSKQYDTRVAGVISGGGNFKPGIVLDKKKSQNVRAPLAMLGKVFCKVEADESPINVGDMLTTSNTPGYAMKATNRRKAFGAVIGKAIQSLSKKKGLIPILIALQ
jgi:hypothetical protein